MFFIFFKSQTSNSYPRCCFGLYPISHSPSDAIKSVSLGFSGSAKMSSGGGFRVSIPTSVRKTIQDIKEITGNHSEEEIYAMLKECNMDPNETAQKLLLQGTPFCFDFLLCEVWLLFDFGFVIWCDLWGKVDVFVTGSCSFRGVCFGFDLVLDIVEWGFELGFWFAMMGFHCLCAFMRFSFDNNICVCELSYTLLEWLCRFACSLKVWS